MTINVNVVKDENGKVIATFENAAVAGGPSIKPVLKPGHTVVQVAAPETYKMNIANLKAFYTANSK